MQDQWVDIVLQNFGNASAKYNQEAIIQKVFAKKLANLCYENSVPLGTWYDLGTGTGLVADALEELHPKQKVIRVDGSPKMLMQHAKNKSLKLWDLNNKLPPEWSDPPNLIASNFALHWLNDPKSKIEQWFSIVSPGGWLALSLPVKGSFTEWHKAASVANVTCTANSFPSHCDITNALPKHSIKVDRLESFTQEAPTVISLLKSIKNVGAQGSLTTPLSVSHWRKLQKAWPLPNESKKPQLSWFIQTILAKK